MTAVDDKLLSRWEKVAPIEVAQRQARWERGELILRLYEAGVIQRKIAARLKVCTARVQQLRNIAARLRTAKDNRPPIVKWYEGTGNPLAPDGDGRST